MYSVYRITNSITNQYYIGVHKFHDNPNDGYYGSGLRIKRSLKAYGKEFFSKEILFIVEIAEEAFNIEKMLLKEHLNDELCLNLTPGGEGGPTMQGRKHSEETKQKLRDNWHLHHANDAPRNYEIMAEKSRATRYAKNGEGYWNSKETREQISIKNTKYPDKPKNQKKTPEEKRAIKSESMRKRYAGTVFMKNLATGKMIRPKKEEVEFYLAQGYSVGRFLSEQSKENIREKIHKQMLSNKLGRCNKGKKWYNNGIKRGRYLPGEEPKNWVLGAKLVARVEI